MAELQICRGLPASGKSSYARDKVKSGSDFIRVNRDDIRESFTVAGGKWNRNRENSAEMIRDCVIRESLALGKTVICDDTNLDPKVFEHLKSLAKQAGVNVKVIDFTDVGPQECIQRDLKRERSVGADVILNMYRRHLRPQPIVQDPALPHVIIVDLDGTLATIGDRDPYDDAKADMDHVNYPVASMVQGYLWARPDVSLVCMSGRDQGRSREATRRWLRLNDLEPHSLVMREAGDTRADNVIKLELFNDYIRDQFFVEFVVDDRDKVVAMWRDELGLPTFQVNWGNF